MKTFKNLLIENIRKICRHGKKMIPGFALLFVVFLWSCSTTSVAQRFEVGVNIELPSWAPYYDNTNLVQYYYLPDIECYYDVRRREFIYLEDGQWMFGRTLPPIYAWFDLNNCFIVALNAQVVEPWRHFHYYVAHYPRYYYRTVYRDRYMDRDHPLRGFNENERNVVYNRRSDMENHSINNRNENRRERFNRNDNRQEDFNRNENKQRNEVKRDFPERRVAPTHAAEPIKYYGREVGRPVKVQRNMRKAEETKVRPEKQAKQERQYRQR